MKIFITFLFTILINTSYLFAELDKTPYSSEEKINKINNLDWKNNYDDPIIEDNDAEAYIDLRNFPYVSYLTNKEQVVQYDFWSTGTESNEAKYILFLYPSEDESNNDSIQIVVDDYIKSGYVDGSDWVNLDTDEALSDQLKSEQKINKERIENGFEPIINIEWVIKPTYIKSKGYVYQTMEFFTSDSSLYNTWIYLLGRDGYMYISLVFDESEKKYIDEKFLTQILDSYVFKEGKSYSDFQEGDEVSSTKASDLVTNKEPELKVYLSEETLCVDTINSVNKTAFSERSKLLILGMVSGFNIYDFYMMENYVGYNSPEQELLNDVADYCLANPGETFILAIIKVLFGDS